MALVVDLMMLCCGHHTLYEESPLGSGEENRIDVNAHVTP